MNGMGKGKFEPDTTLNRAMVATVLYRLSGDKVSELSLASARELIEKSK